MPSGSRPFPLTFTEGRQMLGLPGESPAEMNPLQPRAVSRVDREPSATTNAHGTFGKSPGTCASISWFIQE